MKRLAYVIAFSIVGLLACKTKKSPEANATSPSESAVATPPAPPPSPLTAEEVERALYVLGNRLEQATPTGKLNLSEKELAEVVRGINDSAAGKAGDLNLESFGPKVDALIRQRSKALAEKSKAVGDAFRPKFAKGQGVETLPSGVLIQIEKAGEGKSPSADDIVTVHYRGTLVDGTEFDSSYKRKSPATFSLRGVIACWTEGLQKMKVGGKAKLVCPPETAYRESGNQAIPGNATILFDVELLDVKSQPTAAPAAPGPGSPPNSGGTPNPAN